MKKAFDLAVKTGTYTDAAGATKNRYQSIGALMQGDDGRQFLLLDPLINLAAVPREPGRDRVIVSMFEPKSDSATGQAPAPAARRAPAPAAAPVDDVPF